MRWEGRRQSDNIEDRRGMRISRGGMVGGGIGTIALALLISCSSAGIRRRCCRAWRRAGADDRSALRGIAEGSGVAPTDRRRARRHRGRLERDLRRHSAAQYREPTLVLFNGAVESACGIAESAVGPFYCPADQQVYIDLAFFDQLRRRARRARRLRAGLRRRARGRPSRAEPARHLRRRCTRCSSASAAVEANQLSVRLELQADFFAGSGRITPTERSVLEPGDIEEALRAASAIGDDTLQRSAGRAVVPGFLHAWQLRAAQALVHHGLQDRLRRGLRHLQGGRSLIVHTASGPRSFCGERGRQGRGLRASTTSRSAIPRASGRGLRSASTGCARRRASRTSPSIPSNSASAGTRTASSTSR